MWFLLLIALLSPTTKASEFPFELQQVYLDYKHETDVGYDPVLQEHVPGATLNNHLDLHVDMSVFRFLYWNNMINSTSDNSQFRVFGWEYALGIRLLPCLDVGYYHHSQHIADGLDAAHFPLENAIQIKLFFYSKQNRDSLIDF